MSLFSSLQQANNALQAAQVGLQVTGNNIANVNTPDYLRQRVIYTPAPTQAVGNLRLGLGVKVEAIVQQVDHFLEERLRGSRSDLAKGEAEENTFTQLDALIGELSDTDLSTSLNNFFGSINDILNQPEDLGVRNLTILRGQTLADDISRLYQRVRQVQLDTNDRIRDASGTINGLLTDIAELNVKITQMEGGVTQSDAVGLRDQRQRKLTELSEMIGIRAVEQENGSVSVFAGGEYLVTDGISRQVYADEEPRDGANFVDIKIVDFESPLQTDTGKLAGLVNSRDHILGDFLTRLNDFAKSFTFEFNKVFSSGQGLTGYESIEAEHFVSADQWDDALDQVGLPFTPENGSFQVKLLNRQTGVTETHDIFVTLNGTNEDTSLEDLQTALDDIDGLSASISLEGQLQINADQPNIEFAFADDTSGVLAALGVGTFFTGSSATDLGVNEMVSGDPSKFAASRSGIGKDTDNALDLASFADRALDSFGGTTVAAFYKDMVGGVAQTAAVTKGITEGFRVFKDTLEGQKLGVSGVNLDEEAVRMITFQRQFQASSRMIATLDELLEILVNL
ncbi:Flagellar hook-associated protein 1 [Bremerella volcania]|uniref:Flagellar hook-associated protein 1 n=1 Tax=Bremerella volcania TaxID=2527984 RepID=A0A518CEA4_9BACT|nr:flagellar hook-associated protein FlgK [Bremerella volcania]QDU77551.1 Flagellar hook-associated protein 1 [Bremerella volcania]